LKGCRLTPFFIILANNKINRLPLNSTFLKYHLKINQLKRIIYLSLLFLLNSATLFSQNNAEPVFRKYTVDDGLPSSTIYHVFQDSKGYIWFATANGVSRYDGYKFENFDLQSGLVDNEVFEIYEDYKHRIWFIPLSGKLSYYENNKIVSYKYNNKIKDHLPNSRGPIKCSFYVDSLDYVYLSLKQFGLISISPEGIYKRLDSNDPEIDFKADELPNNKFLISYPSNKLNSFVININSLYQKYSVSHKELFKTRGGTHHHLFVLSAKDSSIILSLYTYVFRIKNGKIIEKYDFNKYDILWISVDRDNNLWIAPQKGGVLCFKDCKITSKPTLSILEEIQVTSVLQDYENAYWFSTLNDGVFYCPNINLFNYTKANGLFDDRINALASNKEGVYVGYEYGFVDLLFGKTSQRYKSTEERFAISSIRSFTVDDRTNRVWVSAIENLYYIKNNKVFASKLDWVGNYIHSRKIILSKKNNSYWIATTKGLIKTENDNITYESYEKNLFNGTVYDIAEDYNNDIWFCTINGLWKYSNNTYQYLNDNPLITQTLNCIHINPIDSSIWLGSNGNGIVIKSKNGIKQITTKDGLTSNTINLLYQSNNEIWAATPNGLSRIILNKDNGYTIQNLTNANGLPTNITTSFCEYNNLVYVGTSKGLVAFDKNKIVDDKTPPKVLIESFKVNNSPIVLNTPSITLNYKQNNLNFNFIGFVYRNEGKVNYRYHIIGIDSNWVYSQTPNCFYSGLTSGKYRFEVEAQSHNGVWSATPATISFTITPPFWKRGWFVVLIASIFSMLILLVFKIRITSIKRRNELLHNINLYKQQSLRQQMNPHFIFNTLNSIQLYILEKDPISSHKYLTKFARLMRMTLDNSLSPTIPLRDEIEALKLYLDLEKLRFEGKFEYVLDFGSNESILNQRIPTLLIQPFVENAIWHGISLKQDQIGIIKIFIIETSKSIICTIEDNGIGRKQADQLKKQNPSEHKSRGSMITQQRIDLLSSLYKERFKIEYEDLYNNLGIPVGTKVYVTIPKNITINIQQ